jgi:threonylcarbamoyladenosine tRNA methylthiotransferase MtaB
MPILKTVTLGCKVNQYETQYAREGFLRLGYQEAIGGEAADLILVNTCTVTAESEAKSRKIIRQLANKYPNAEIVVMGCYATRAPDEAAVLPGVVEVLQDKRELPDLLARWAEKGTGPICAEHPSGRDRPSVGARKSDLSPFPQGISTFEGRHRAWVKVQDGCREGCSYCIIPLVRPNLSSRPMDDVLAEIRCLVDAGFAEIVLTGIHLGHYGADITTCQSARPTNLRLVPVAALCKGNALSDLLRRIVALNGEFRIRLSSIEAAEVTPELLDLMAEQPHRICPHLHIPMQSGSDRILEKMRRRWPIRRFIDRCHEIRGRLDQPALTTDVIVGFPGETEEDFAATCRAAEEVEFSKIHVFRFSPRQGTEAAKMPNRVPQRIHRCWAAEMAKLEKRLADRYLENLLGKRLQVLVEGKWPNSPSKLIGTADRYITVELHGEIDLVGRLIYVTSGLNR